MEHNPHGKVSILYVEDEAGTRETVVRLLEKNGLDCLVAENGQEGLELYRRYRPDIVLSDIRMPIMSGLEMARAIRPEFPEAQFIFMTALGESAAILQAVDIGVRRYVVKPVVFSKLLAAISDCVAIVRLQAEAQRVRHLESIGVLAGGLAHDFNNLLQIVLGNVALAKRHLEPGSAGYGYLVEAEKVSRDARSLGKRLGTLARRENGLQRKSELAPMLAYSVKAALVGSPVTATFDVPPDIPPVKVDRTQMEQVFSHLALNAVEAMPQGGTLEIAADINRLSPDSGWLLAPGDYLRISFRDYGIGIPPENLSRIFDPYFTTKEMDSHKGRGLGLSVCHAIISRHGGRIGAGNSPDTGAVFTIWLPVAAE